MRKTLQTLTPWKISVSPVVLFFFKRLNLAHRSSLTLYLCFQRHEVN